jgi:phosphonate degradation associated HDIG domain protein
MVQTIINLFKEKGHSEYGGEAVTQLEHALQAATLAINDNASDFLITAALLHDIGHLLHELPDNAPDHGIDDVHEVLAYKYLSKYFPDEVVIPVQLHVEAKRYLCYKSEAYYNELSETSKQSLRLQGGVMTNNELDAFEKNKFFNEAIQLRKWDDLAKNPMMTTPNIDFFTKHIQNALK